MSTADPSSGQGRECDAPFDQPISALTWNIYLGGDISGVIGAPPDELPSRTEALWETVQQTDFRPRAAAITGQIVQSRPDVVALQEVYRWSKVVRRPLREGSPDVEIEYDFLEILLEALKKRGAHYFPAVRSPGADVLLPGSRGRDIRLEDSVAILLKTGADAPELDWRNPRQGRFAASLRTTFDGEPFDIRRLWASVDLRRGPAALRVVTTHLEYFDPNVQPLQLAEILAGPAAVKAPLLLLGDFNSRPGSPAWTRLKDLGYRDAWECVGPGEGLSSSQDADLRNPQSKLYERIDWIMCRGAIEVLSAKRLGADPADRTPNGLWPSDHAGVLAELRVTMGG
jgi:endonuclease/exonuclease/phosphatase family metal-dependent hydrolase